MLKNLKKIISFALIFAFCLSFPVSFSASANTDDDVRQDTLEICLVEDTFDFGEVEINPFARSSSVTMTFAANDTSNGTSSVVTFKIAANYNNVNNVCTWDTTVAPKLTYTVNTSGYTVGLSSIPSYSSTRIYFKCSVSRPNGSVITIYGYYYFDGTTIKMEQLPFEGKVSHYFTVSNPSNGTAFLLIFFTYECELVGSNMRFKTGVNPTNTYQYLTSGYTVSPPVFGYKDNNTLNFTLACVYPNGAKPAATTYFYYDGTAFKMAAITQA